MGGFVSVMQTLYLKKKCPRFSSESSPWYVYLKENGVLNSPYTHKDYIRVFLDKALRKQTKRLGQLQKQLQQTRKGNVSPKAQKNLLKMIVTELNKEVKDACSVV